MALELEILVPGLLNQVRFVQTTTPSHLRLVLMSLFSVWCSGHDEGPAQLQCAGWEWQSDLWSAHANHGLFLLTLAQEPHRSPRSPPTRGARPNHLPRSWRSRSQNSRLA